MEDFLNNPLIYLSMPLISAIVGWGTNVVAIKMTFYPIEFFGKPPFLGWQGIVPRKAVKMSEIAVDLMTSRLISVEEVFSKLEPERVATELAPGLDRLMDELTTDIMQVYAPKLWETLPLRIKDQIVNRVRAETPANIKDLMTEIKVNITTLFDLKHMVISNLLKNKSILNDIFLKVGAKEFKFIERSGIYFGFFFGCIQMLVWMFYKGDWVLPVAGFVVGYATNAIALKLIFEPQKPIKIGPFILQGLFLKRQNEVAGDYGALIASEILNPPNITESILSGPTSEHLFKMMERSIKKAIDANAGLGQPFVVLGMGTKEYIEMKEMAVKKIIENTSELMKGIYKYSEEAMDIENTMREKMQQLTPTEFEGILRPAFQEDEFTLILVGAALGVAVGFFQLLVMFA